MDNFLLSLTRTRNCLLVLKTSITARLSKKFPTLLLPLINRLLRFKLRKWVKDWQIRTVSAVFLVRDFHFMFSAVRVSTSHNRAESVVISVLFFLLPAILPVSWFFFEKLIPSCYNQVIFFLLKMNCCDYVLMMNKFYIILLKIWNSIRVWY